MNNWKEMCTQGIKKAYQWMTITGTHIAYYHLCYRKLWLLTEEIRMEIRTNNQSVEEGKLINETS